MSTCPETDLHNVYLDDEMPPDHLLHYKAHLDTCPLCQKKVSSLTAVRNALKDDAGQIELTDEALEEGYDRLLTRMRYHQTTVTIQDAVPFVFRQTLPWAAAVVLLITGAYVFLHGTRQNTGDMIAANGAAFLESQAAEAAAADTVVIFENTISRGLLTTSNNETQVISIQDLPYIPDIDIFRPSFVYAGVLGRKRTQSQQLWHNGVILAVSKTVGTPE
jgi:hypothetical protein